MNVETGLVDVSLGETLQAACVLVICNETAFLWWYKLCDFTLFHS